MSSQAQELHPIMHPLFNLREVCKQVALLEDHLNQVRKRCPDCIRKHFLTIEALLEEAISLDSDPLRPGRAQWAPHLDGHLTQVLSLGEWWVDGGDEREIAQELRAIRKDLAPLCFDMREMTKEARAGSGRPGIAWLIAEVALARRVAHTG